MSDKLKYLGYTIVFQEVPNEVTLAINISGCPHKCEGCHSKYLWDYNGDYISDDLEKLIKKYDGLITCVCFMGGDQNLHELMECFKVIKSHGLKTCLYSGLDNILSLNQIAHCCDYLKIGHYDEKLGGLNNPITNQKFYKHVGTKFIDMTYLFQKR